MQANRPAKIETSTLKIVSSTPGQASPAIDYARPLDELLELYSGLDQAALALPIAAPAHFDVRGLLRCPRMGEAHSAAFFRPLVIGLLHWHFRNRLSALRQHILLETRFSEDAAKGALAKMDRAIDFWRLRITVGSVLFGWVLPLAGPVTWLWKWAFPQAAWTPASWFVLSTVGASLFYVLVFLSGSFSVKRGLVLGGTGHAAHRPELLPGAGGYAREREILGPLGLAVSEFPLDLALYFGSFSLVPLFQLSIPGFIGSGSFFILIILAGVVSVSTWIAWTRRKRLGRC